MRIEKHLLPHPTAMLFDWDNTLVSSFKIIVTAINEALAHFEMPLWTEEEVRHKTQLSAKDWMPFTFGEKWLQALEIYTASYKQHANLLDPFPGAKSLLGANKNLNIRMSIISNKRKAILQQEIEQLGWEHFFEVIIGSGDLKADKPSPLPVYHVLEKMNLSAGSNIWFVGDAPVDWQCAEASGCLPIPLGYENEMAKTYPQTMANCDELEKILLKR